MKKILTLLGLFLLPVLTSAEWTITPGWQILFAGNTAIAAEKTAARELAGYLQKITGHDFPIRQEAAGKKLVIGYHPEAIRFFGQTALDQLGAEEFLIKSGPDETIYIIGGRPRGTLFGVYHFLDNLLGVHWYSPEFEYVPSKEKITLPELNIHEKPAFEYRKRSNPFGRYRFIFGVGDPAWIARNRLNDNGSIMGNKHARILEEYGKGVHYAPPYPCHALHLLVPPQTHFKEHPEWWALQDGKRQVYGSARGVSASYCLTNPELLAETIVQVKKNLRQFPDSSYVSVAEGDHTKGPCECTECQALQAKYGGKESGVWVNFVNRVADGIKEEFPHVKISTLAYTRTADPPENISVRDNVIIWLCIWSKPRGLAYDDPRNEDGHKFMDETLRKWTAIAKNVHIWDYVTTYENVFLPIPDMRFNIDNLKAYKEAGVTGVYPEGSQLPEGSGSPFKFWLLARAQWNPDNLDYDALLKTFCDEYYGASAGPYILRYWQMLEEANRQAGYYLLGQGGWQGNAPHASREIMLKADELYRQALAAAETPLYRKHVRIAHVPVQYTVLQNWRDWSRQGAMPGTLEQYYTDTLRTAEEFDLYHNKTQKLADLLPLLRNMGGLDFTATASGNYGGSTPYQAFDGDLNSRIAFGGFSGWLQVEFPEPREISRITTAFGKNNRTGEYEITGSLDGKTWIPLVPRHTIELTAEQTTLFGDDRLAEPVQVKFVRTRVAKFLHRRDGKRNWTGINEQLFNAKELPSSMLK